MVKQGHDYRHRQMGPHMHTHKCLYQMLARASSMCQEQDEGYQYTTVLHM